ncbi:beta-1,3-galactosyltransferase 2 isoform X2 [Xenopus laevis]|nr:beta-1,3-galactosyltransferase 2 isoform X2 [Xenopus laevis]XP_041443175.1 beta-1,3-galactosyltransferase 2 isoform X2 [Xenopus laevis]
MNKSITQSLWTIKSKILKLCLFLFLATMAFMGFHYHSINMNLVPSTVHPRTVESLYPYLIEEPSKCRGDPPFLLLLIPSMPQDVLIRDVLRKTWANESLVPGISIKRIFLLGRSFVNDTEVSVEQESSTFHDIIQQDFLDTYRNLTIKTLMGIEWVSRLCPRASYVMKVDGDMFFNPWFLVRQILQPEKPLKLEFFTGLVVRGAPFRNKDSKWYISYEMYSKNLYPYYCSGTGYVFSGDLSPRIYKEAKGMTIFPFEDVFLGICLERMGVHLSKSGGEWFIGERVEYNRCRFTKLVTVHHYSPDELLKLWPDFLKALGDCNG